MQQLEEYDYKVKYRASGAHGNTNSLSQCELCIKLEQNLETESQNCNKLILLADKTWDSVIVAKEQTEDDSIFKLKQ